MKIKKLWKLRNYEIMKLRENADGFRQNTSQT